MTTWTVTAKLVSEDGRTIIYEPAEGSPHAKISVESRRRPIPHSNRAGTWDLTTYFVVRDGVDVAEKHTLADAKKAAEELLRKDGEKWQLGR